ncbi:hypothetical protein [Ekhidna sp.]
MRSYKQPNTMTRFIKHVLTSVILVTIAQTGFGQIRGGENLIMPPPSPEAAAFAEYGNHAISYYTGKPNISVPIYDISYGKLNHSISLDYSPGIQVTQIASNVGLGWNLRAGGSVVRNVHNLPDDHTQGHSYEPFYSNASYGNQTVNYYFNYFRNNGMDEGVHFTESSGILEDYFDFKEDIEIKSLETVPDSYTFSVDGLSGTIYIDYDNNTAFCLEHPDIDVEVIFSNWQNSKPIVGWVITDKMGTTYKFGGHSSPNSIESTLSYTENIDLEYVIKYNSAWNLTEISSYDGKDAIHFEYGTRQSYDQEQSYFSQTSRTDTHNESYGSCFQSTSTNHSNSSSYRIEKGFLESIAIGSSSNKLITFEYDLSERIDLKGQYALKNIQIKNHENEVLNRVKLHHDYFGDPTSTHEHDSRLKLDKVALYDQTTKPQEYSFTYFSPEDVPSRTSMAQDWLGYYNGENSNKSLIPVNPEFDNHNTDAGNRDFSFNHSKVGTLRTVTYPTGGSSEYFYETNTTTYWQSFTRFEVAGSEGLSGGSTPENIASNPFSYCDDLTPDIIPDIEMKTFTIDEEGYYRVKYERIGTPGVDPLIEAFFYEGDRDDYCDLYEEPLLFKVNTPEIDEKEEGIYLETGTYSIMVVNSDPSIQVNLAVGKYVTTNSELIKDLGSLRIGRIVDKNEENVAVKVRKLQYGNGEFHRGLAFEKLIYFETPNVSGAGEHPVTCNALQRYSHNLNTPTRYEVTYPTVTELSYDGTETTFNGKTEYNYYNESEGRLQYPLPLIKPLNGINKSTKYFRYSQSLQKFDLVKKVENDFEALEIDTSLDPPSKAFWFSYVDDAFVDVGLYKDSQSSSTYYFMGAPSNTVDFLASHAGGSEGYLVGETQRCGIDGLHLVRCYPGPVSHFYRQVGGARRYWMKNLSSTTVDYFPESGDSLMVRTVNEYGSSDHYQVTKSETINSDGTSNIFYYDYPHDVSDQSSAMNYLLARHRIAEPIYLKETFDDGSGEIELARKETTYADFATYYLPSEISISQPGGQPQVTKVLKYDSRNRIREIQNTSGIASTYVHGYGSGHIIAVAEGATYAEFLTSLGGSTSLIGDGGRAYSDAQHNTIVNNLSNAFVTTYEYKDGVGMTKMRDPNERKTLFEFDDYNRLKLVKDNENKLVKEYNYNHTNAPQTIEGSIDISGDLIQGSTVTFTANITTALTGNTTYRWDIDGTIYEGSATVSHVFDTERTNVPVTLRVSNISFNSLEKTEFIDVEEIPFTGQISIVGCADNDAINTISVSGLSAYRPEEIQYEWKIANEVVSTEPSFDHVFGNVTNTDMVVKLTMTSPYYGNTVQRIKTRYIVTNPLPTALIIFNAISSQDSINHFLPVSTAVPSHSWFSVDEITSEYIKVSFDDYFVNDTREGTITVNYLDPSCPTKIIDVRQFGDDGSGGSGGGGGNPCDPGCVLSGTKCICQ